MHPGILPSLLNKERVMLTHLNAYSATVLSLVIGVAACSDKVDPLASGKSIRREIGQQQVANGPQTLDQRFTALAGSAPGFGGFYYEGPNVLVIRATSIANPTQVRDAVAAFLNAEGRVTPPTIRFLDAAYDFGQLNTWHWALSNLVLNIPGVVFTDADEARNQVVVGTSDLSVSQTIQLAAARAGLPKAALLIEQTAPVNVEQQPTLQGTNRPVPGGVQIQSVAGTCSLNSDMQLRFGWDPGNFDPAGYFITASHCTDAFGSVTNMAMGQPTFSDQIGLEAFDPPLFTGGSCPAGRQCRWSDAAAFRYDDVNNWQFPYLADATSTSPFPIEDLDLVQFMGLVHLGDGLRKMGRTTGDTRGVVIATCVNLNQSNGGVDTGRTMLCQYRGNYDSGPGDSGATISSPDGGAWDGIHWGSGGAFSDWAGFDRDFNVYGLWFAYYCACD